jgi:FixJ family two-component response regulator
MVTLSEHQSSTSQASAGPVHALRRKPLIGVVDDDASILRALGRLLASAGFAVKTFASGETFLAFEHPDEIDCLVLDVHLGGLDGFEVQERFRVTHSSVPVIFITAHDDDATQEHARRVGAARYLRKPFNDEALIQAIWESLGRK